MSDNLHLIQQALRLPQGLIRSVKPTVVWQQRAHAYELDVVAEQAGVLQVDARQLPVNIAGLQGQYGELGLYATGFSHLEAIAHPHTVHSARYLGEQLSLVFFDDLLARYRQLLAQDALPEELYPEDDGIPQFQDDYLDRLATYTPQGFMLGDYESAPFLRFGWGTVVLTQSAKEQLDSVVPVGGWVNAAISEWSLASFKSLSLPN